MAMTRAHCFVKEFTLKPTTLPKAVNVLKNHVWLGEAGGIGRCTVVRPPDNNGEEEGDSLVGQVREIGGMFPYYEEVVKWDSGDAKFCLQYKLVDGGGDDRRSPSWPIVNHLSTVVMTPSEPDGVHVQWKVEHDSSWWFTPIFHRILDQNVGVSVTKTFQDFVTKQNTGN